VEIFLVLYLNSYQVSSMLQSAKYHFLVGKFPGTTTLVSWRRRYECIPV